MAGRGAWDCDRWLQDTTQISMGMIIVAAGSLHAQYYSESDDQLTWCGVHNTDPYSLISQH